MRLKYKNTNLNPKALVYRRFIGIEKSLNLQIIYNIRPSQYVNGVDWTFDYQKEEFTQVPNNITYYPDLQNSKYIIGYTNKTVFKYQDYYYIYRTTGWEKSKTIPQGMETLENLGYNNIGRYQVNQYYYDGSFDFVIKGSISGSTTQYVKGNIIPLTSLNIKYFSDEINLTKDDLVVIDGRLYSIEDVELNAKRMPKAFNIYFATLNNIL